MRDWDRTIISQYANSAVLCQLIENVNEYVDPAADLQRFYSLIWSVDTAEGYGLDVWGRIVGVDRVLNVPTSAYLGFAESGTYVLAPFGQAPLYNGVLANEGEVLDDETYRRLIMARAAFNITNGSIPAINQILLNLFPGRGRAYVTDRHDPATTLYFTFAEQRGSFRAPVFLAVGDEWLTGEDGELLTTTSARTNPALYAWGFDQQPFGDFAPLRPTSMRLVYTFDFELAPVEVAMVLRSGALPRPTGVLASAAYRR